MHNGEMSRVRKISAEKYYDANIFMCGLFCKFAHLSVSSFLFERIFIVKLFASKLGFFLVKLFTSKFGVFLYYSRI